MLLDRGLTKFLSLGLVSYLVWYIAYQYFLKDFTLLDEYLIHSMVVVTEVGVACHGLCAV